MRKVYIACDNAATELRDTIRDYARSLGYDVQDLGVEGSLNPTEYPLVAEKLCGKLIAENYEPQGILICGTGLGMAICANKFKGIRATVCHDSYSAERAKLSNDANVLCMGARVIGPELAKKIVKEWLSLEFVDGSSTPKVNCIKELDNKNFK